MVLSATEQALLHDFERKEAAALASFHDRVRKKPILETLSNGRSLFRAVLVLPIPWVCLYTTVQLGRVSFHHEGGRNKLHPVGFVVAFVIGYFVADLIAGLLHMRFDTVPLRMMTATERSWMEFIAWGFQRHHVVQQNWRQDDLLESAILTSGLFAVPFYVFYLYLQQSGQITSPYTAFAWTTCITTGMHTQVFHAAAHNSWKGTTVQSFVWRPLMDLGLVLDTKTHHLHHTQFDCNFAIINGWSNFLLNPLYRYLEGNGYIHPDMEAHVQRKVYIQGKAQLEEPYCRMFPEYRALQAKQNQQQGACIQ